MVSAASLAGPKPIPAESFYSKPTKPGKKILIGEKNSAERAAWGGALHDPNAPGALVMPRPPPDEAKRR